MVDSILPLPGLSPVAGNQIVARFDGGRLSSDGGLLVLREIEQRLKVADRLAACIDDPRDPGSTVHPVADIIRFRLLMIAAGYEDGNDATGLRSDPLFKLALERRPSDRDLCSQSTISRLENLPDARTLLRLGRALVDVWCGSFRQVPRRITLDIDDTFDPVHGGQQLRLFNAHYDEYGFQPIVVFDAEGRFVTALLRPARRPKGVEIRAFLRRLVRAIRSHWPEVEILVRADSHYACPEVLDWCETQGLDYILGLAPTSTLRRHITGLEESTAARFKAAPSEGKVRRFKEFFDAAKTWIPRPPHRRPCRGRRRRHRHPLHRHQPRPRQRPLPVPGPLLPARPGGEPQQGLENSSRRRPHLVPQGHRLREAGRSPSQFRLFLHAGAYWLLWSLRTLMPKRSSWRVAQFDTLRLRLIKTAARVVELKTRIKIHLPSSAPDQAIWHLALGRLPRLVT